MSAIYHIGTTDGRKRASLEQALAEIGVELPVNLTCPNGVRGLIQMHFGNGDDYHKACLDLLEEFGQAGRELDLDEIGNMFSEDEIMEILKNIELWD